MSVVGWRYWSVVSNEYGAGLCSPFAGRADRDGKLSVSFARVDPITSHTIAPARCWQHDGHVPPADGCECGWRLTVRLRDLVGWLINNPARYKAIPTMAIGQVRSVGHVVPWVRAEDYAYGDDPSQIYRAAGLQFAGPLYLAPAATALLGDRAAGFAEQLGVEVVRSQRSQRGWLQALHDRERGINYPWVWEAS